MEGHVHEIKNIFNYFGAWTSRLIGSMEIKLSSCIRGYHIYQRVWTPVIGEKLKCERDVVDGYAVGVFTMSATLVGHLPKKISLICSIFLRSGGTITCEVSGGRRYSSDLVQGGLEMPYWLIFRGEELRKLIHDRNA